MPLSCSWRVLAGVCVVAGIGLLRVGPAQASGCPQRPPPAATADYQGFKGDVFEQGNLTMPYRLFVPPGYDPATKYPLVLYLHHAGLAGESASNETGRDNCTQLTEEIGSGGYGGVFVHSATAEDKTKFVTQEKYPHFLLAPHAASPSYGFGGGVEGSATVAEHATRPLIYGILDKVKAEFNVDPKRLYVTGISMGCYGTWDIVMRNPSYFAAAAPQSCRGDPNETLLSKLIDTPIWSMCGTEDTYFQGAQAMADAMQNVGAKQFTFTALEGVGHSIHDLGYDYPGFIDWMFAQALPPDPVSGVGGAGGSAGAPGAGGASQGGAPAQAGAGGAAGGAGGGVASAGAEPVLAGSGPDSAKATAAPSEPGCSCVAGSAGASSRRIPGASLGSVALLWLLRRRRSARAGRPGIPSRTA